MFGGYEPKTISFCKTFGGMYKICTMQNSEEIQLVHQIKIKLLEWKSKEKYIKEINVGQKKNI